MARRADPITSDEAVALNVTVPHRRVTLRNGSFPARAPTAFRLPP
jgi:hypothetical protein